MDGSKEASAPPMQGDPDVLLTGVALGESPRWHEGKLWFSDWVAREIVTLDPGGARKVVAQVDALPFSIDWLSDGRLLITSGPTLQRMKPDGSIVTHVDLSELTDHGLNEIVVDGRDNAYVNGIGFDLMGGEEFAPGMIALVRPDGSTGEVAGEMEFPNGMAVTPDNATLIVAESYGNRLTGFDIASDGSLSNRRVWADLGDGVPDGICIDAEGAVWYADVPNKRCVRVREGGEMLQTVEVDRGCFACMLGGVSGRTLYVMAQEWTHTGGVGEGPPTGRVLSVEAPAPGAGWP